MWMSGTGAPTNAVTGAGVAQKGSTYVRTSNGAIYYNTGTKASPTWSLVGAVGALAQHHIFVGNAGGVATDVALSGDATITDGGVLTLAGAVTKYAGVTIPAADIIAVGAGKFGHANGYPLVAGVADNVIEFISATLIYDQSVKQYTAGGDTTVNWSGGGAVLSNKIANSEFCAHNGDTVNLVQALVPATGISSLTGTGINLVSTVAFADGGVGALGVVRVKVCYRLHATGL
jgi:hypothetical protein